MVLVLSKERIGKGATGAGAQGYVPPLGFFFLRGWGRKGSKYNNFLTCEVPVLVVTKWKLLENVRNQSNL